MSWWHSDTRRSQDTEAKVKNINNLLLRLAGANQCVGMQITSIQSYHYHTKKKRLIIMCCYMKLSLYFVEWTNWVELWQEL